MDKYFAKSLMKIGPLVKFLQHLKVTKVNCLLRQIIKDPSDSGFWMENSRFSNSPHRFVFQDIDSKIRMQGLQIYIFINVIDKFQNPSPKNDLSRGLKKRPVRIGLKSLHYLEYLF